MISKILLTRRKILLNILARLIKQYVFIDGLDGFVRSQGWWDTVVNNYSD